LNVAEMSRFRDVKIVFAGKLIPLRAAPEVIDGISIAPLREIFERCDGTLYWFHEEKRVRAVNPTTEMELRIGDKTAKVNGAEETLVLAPYIKNGRTMVPLQFIAGTLDVTVSFNSNTGELIVSRNGF
ncbi:MAG: copper amine oxidase N-terminal domain-containing protein, partial [Candidatus Zipacnadales bacterium]